MKNIKIAKEVFEQCENYETVKLFQIYTESIKKHQERFLKSVSENLANRGWINFREEVVSLKENYDLLWNKVDLNEAGLDFNEIIEARNYINDLFSLITLAEEKYEPMELVKEKDLAFILEDIKTICAYTDITHLLEKASRERKFENKKATSKEKNVVTFTKNDLDELLERKRELEEKYQNAIENLSLENEKTRVV